MNFKFICPTDRALSAECAGPRRFIVEAEKRYWLRPPSFPQCGTTAWQASASIPQPPDGTIVGQQLEEVLE